MVVLSITSLDKSPGSDDTDESAEARCRVLPAAYQMLLIHCSSFCCCPSMMNLLPAHDGYRALDVPMLYVLRHGRVHDTVGASFRDFMQGRLQALPGALRTHGSNRTYRNEHTTSAPPVVLSCELRYLSDLAPHRQCAALPCVDDKTKSKKPEALHDTVTCRHAGWNRLLDECRSCCWM